MIEREFEIFSESLLFDPTVFASIKTSVEQGLLLDKIRGDRERKRKFEFFAANTIQYCSGFLQIPGPVIEIGREITSDGKEYMASAEFNSGNPKILFSPDYIESHIIPVKETRRKGKKAIDTLKMSPIRITAHECYHIWQFFSFEGRLSRDSYNTSGNTAEWNKTLSERGANLFGQMAESYILREKEIRENYIEYYRNLAGFYNVMPMLGKRRGGILVI